MASIIDAFNDSISENYIILKLIIYSIPAYFISLPFINSQPITSTGMIIAILLAIIIGITIIAAGIHNVRMNKLDVLTLNPILLCNTLYKEILVLLPQVLIYYLISKFLTSSIDKMQEIFPHFYLIAHIIIYVILGTLLMTSFLAFAKYLSIKDGYNIPLVLESFGDVLLAMLFFVIQLLICNIILVGPVLFLSMYIFPMIENAMNIQFSAILTHILYCIVAVLNVSITANYFSQVAFEVIKGNNRDYQDKVQIGLEEMADRIRS